jgi:hypothetical protein
VSSSDPLSPFEQPRSNAIASSPATARRTAVDPGELDVPLAGFEFLGVFVADQNDSRQVLERAFGKQRDERAVDDCEAFQNIRVATT